MRCNRSAALSSRAVLRLTSRRNCRIGCRRTTKQFGSWVICLCVLLGTFAVLIWAEYRAVARPDIEPQPQPRLRMRGDFDIIEFANGSQWYLKQGSINAIWGVPRGDQERLGFKTKIYGTGYEVTINKEITQILEELYRGDQEELQELIDRLEEVEQ